MENKPMLYILAGPNGIGKTSSFYDIIPQNMTFINADDIAKQLREKTGDVNIQEIANGEATKLMNNLIAQKANFGFETNLADNETWKFIENIQLIGYEIVVNFYCIDDVEICINRVFNRVKEGGHFVRPDIVRMRYENGLKLLKYYFNLPDKLILTNNADSPIEFLVAEKGEIIYSKNNLPEWIISVLPEVKHDILPNESIDEIKDRYRNKEDK